VSTIDSKLEGYRKEAERTIDGTLKETRKEANEAINSFDKNVQEVSLTIRHFLVTATALT